MKNFSQTQETPEDAVIEWDTRIAQVARSRTNATQQDLTLLDEFLKRQRTDPSPRVPTSPHSAGQPQPQPHQPFAAGSMTMKSTAKSIKSYPTENASRRSGFSPFPISSFSFSPERLNAVVHITSNPPARRVIQASDLRGHIRVSEPPTRRKNSCSGFLSTEHTS